MATLAACSALCVALVAMRVWYAHELHFGFLLWNLLLAWVPMGLALWFDAATRRRATLRGRAAAIGIGWLLFFPNAPYIVTDFVHLYDDPPVPIWFDVLAIAAFAWTGLLIAVASLGLVHGAIRRVVPAGRAWLLLAAATVLGAFGVYVGRFLRWNSWDVLRDPGAIVRDLGGRLASPLEHPRTLVVTGIVALLVGLSYLVVEALTGLRAESASPPTGP